MNRQNATEPGVYIQINKPEAGELAQQVRALVALTKDLGFVPGTH